MGAYHHRLLHILAALGEIEEQLHISRCTHTGLEVDDSLQGHILADGHLRLIDCKGCAVACQAEIVLLEGGYGCVGNLGDTSALYGHCVLDQQRIADARLCQSRQ